MFIHFLLACLLVQTYGFTPRRRFVPHHRRLADQCQLTPTYSGSWEAARQLADADVAKMTTLEKIGIVTGVGQLNSNREGYQFSPTLHPLSHLSSVPSPHPLQADALAALPPYRASVYLLFASTMDPRVYVSPRASLAFRRELTPLRRSIGG